ncbi:hypothetical protein ASD44_09670 [Mesorhizobium sp. Root554]|uniref:phage protease n=1 Tax=unclassified Mesorhizobium TaxID=325217 RepID=UPI0006F2CE30|nr:MULTISPECIES: phage protease [unclassified Mesorhizobium]KQZ14310.1 hypothetical protein ASD27_09680 [Mesorhizobium sp. Root1471]KQZ36821.1 hypothetical protein ASD44_09670 [Mesorhizobium sp. Root554]
MFRHLAEPVSLHAAGSTGEVSLCAAMALADSDGAPEWVHLLPAGTIRTGDGRGPYRIADVPALMAASLAAGDKLVLDENHSTDLAAPRGEAAPARGWIVELQGRADGVWGRVEWTEEGTRLVRSKAYRGVSPVIQHLADGTVTALLRASLVNRPNLRGLAALHHQENEMNLLEKLLKALGLDAATTEEAAIAAVTTLHAEKAAGSTALQSALDPIAKTIGLQAGADAAAVLLGVQGVAATAAGKSADGQVVDGLQQELTLVTTRLNTLVETGKREKAEAFVDAAIKAGRVGVKPQRERYVAMHMADAANAEALIGAMPILGGGQITMPVAPNANGEVSLNAEQRQAAKLLGIDEKAMAETLKAERETAL